MKGAILAEFLRWYAARANTQSLGRLIDESPLCRQVGFVSDDPAFGLIQSAWYPASAIHWLTDATLTPLAPSARSALLREGVDHVTERLFRGLYSVLFTLVATPDRYGRHIQRAWRQLHDSGEREVNLVGPGQAVSITRDWPAHHPVLCEIVSETTRAVFTRMKVGIVEIERSQCISRGDTMCVTKLRWQQSVQR